jgi:hypothetical protein
MQLCRYLAVANAAARVIAAEPNVAANPDV